MSKIPGKVNVFNQFGFIPLHPENEQQKGNCPFCGKHDHFYINTVSTNKTWDCKSCGKAGGFKTFIEQMAIFCHSKLLLSKEVSKWLLDNRGNAFTYNTIVELGVGYHPFTGQFTIPIMDITGKNIISLKIYNGKSFYVVAGCKAEMYGTWVNDFSNVTGIFISEGEWDFMTLYEIMHKLKIENIGIVGVPGAGTFKEDILPYLQGKEIYQLYDNDKAGRQGQIKTAEILINISKAVYYLKWPDGIDEEYDIRDLRVKAHLNYQETYDFIVENLVEYTPKENKPVQNMYTQEVPDYRDIFDIFTKHLHIPDTTILDVIFGTILGNRLEGSPLWIMIVAPPGGLKTEPLMALGGVDCIEVLSTLTPHTLISGTNFGGGGDPSLVPKLNGKVLIVKDFTAIMSLPSQETEEILGILRDVYDGECSKPFGNGIWRRYKSKFGIIAAVTPAIEGFLETHTTMGERFLRWRNYLPKKMEDRSIYIRKAIDNTGKEGEIRAELIGAAHKILKADYSGNVPILPDYLRERLVWLSQMIAQLRTIVPRDKYTREIINIPEAEMPTRISKELIKLIMGVSMLHQVKECGEEEYNVAIQVAKGSVPYRMYLAFTTICKFGSIGTGLSDVMNSTGLPSSTCHQIVENLVMLGMVLKEKIDGSIPVRCVYRVPSDVLNYAIECKFVEEICAQ